MQREVVRDAALQLDGHFCSNFRITHFRFNAVLCERLRERQWVQTWGFLLACLFRTLWFMFFIGVWVFDEFIRYFE